MKEIDPQLPADPLQAALDEALARSMVAPALPVSFRRGLRAAIARSGQTDHAVLRARLEHERQQQLAELHSGYVRVSRRTLGLLVGAAFVGGIATVLAMPWLTLHFGSSAGLVLAGIGGALALAISAPSWWPGEAISRLLD